MAGAPEEAKGEAGRVSQRKPREKWSPGASSSEGSHVLGTERGGFSHSQEDYGHLVDSDP